MSVRYVVQFCVCIFPGLAHFLRMILAMRPRSEYLIKSFVNIYNIIFQPFHLAVYYCSGVQHLKLA